MLEGKAFLITGAGGALARALIPAFHRAVAVAMERLREGLGQGVLQSLCIGTYLGMLRLLVKRLARAA